MKATWLLLAFCLFLPAIGSAQPLDNFDEFRSYPFMERGYRAAEAEDWRKVEELMRFLLEKVPHHQEARGLLVQSLQNQGRYEEAAAVVQGDTEVARTRRLNLRLAWIAAKAVPRERIEPWLEETPAPGYTRLWQAYALDLEARQGPEASWSWLRHLQPRDDERDLAIWRGRFAEKAGKPDAVIAALEPVLRKGKLPSGEKDRLAQAYISAGAYGDLRRLLTTLDSPQRIADWRVAAIRRAVGSGDSSTALRWLQELDSGSMTPDLRQNLWQLVLESGDVDRILRVGEELGQPCLDMVAQLAPLALDRARQRLDLCDPGEDPQRWLVLARQTDAVESLAGKEFPSGWREQQQEQLLAMWMERDDVQAALDWLERQPRSNAALKQEAELAQSRGLYGRAIPVWLELYQRNGDLQALDQATFLLGAMGQHQRALRELEQAWSQQARNESLYRRMAGLYARSDTALSPERLEPLLNVLDRGAREPLLARLAGADLCDLVEASVPPPPRSAVEWRALGDCAMPARPGAAVVFYRRAQAEHASADVQKALAYALADAGDPAGAAQILRQFAPSELDHAGGLAAARELQQVGDISAAQRYWEPLKARDSDVWHTGALIALDAGEYELATERERKALAESPDPALYHAAARTALKAGEEQQSLEWLGRAATLAPDNPRYRAEYGLRLSSRPDKASRLAAIPHLEAAVAAMPEDFRLHHALGLRYAERGAKSRARTALRRAIDNLDPRLTVAEFNQDELVQMQYDQRRSHETLSRRNSVSFSSTWHPDGITTTPGRQLAGENTQVLLWDHVLSNDVVPPGRELAVYGRLLTSGEGREQYGEGAALGVGLRYKPLSDYNLNLYAELYGEKPGSSESIDEDLMLRATASFLDGGRFRNEWRPVRDHWPRRSLYLDAAWFAVDDERQLLARFERGHAWKLPLSGAQSLEPYGVLQAMEQNQGEDWRAGVGIRWQLWFDDDEYNAFRKRFTLRAEYQKDLGGSLYDDATGWLFGLEVQL